VALPYLLILLKKTSEAVNPHRQFALESIWDASGLVKNNQLVVWSPGHVKKRRKWLSHRREKAPCISRCIVLVMACQCVAYLNFGRVADLEVLHDLFNLPIEFGPPLSPIFLVTTREKLRGLRACDRAGRLALSVAFLPVPADHSELRYRPQARPD
jgi:hypothetical protein